MQNTFGGGPLSEAVLGRTHEPECSTFEPHLPIDAIGVVGGHAFVLYSNSKTYIYICIYLYIHIYIYINYIYVIYISLY